MTPPRDVLVPTLMLAVASLVIGLSLFIWLVRRRDAQHFYATTVICWLLLALFPGLILFLLFPDSTTTGQLMEFKFGGAAAFWIAIWVLGVKFTNESMEKDRIKDGLQEKLGQAEAELERARRSMSITSNGRKPAPIESTQAIRYKIKDKPTTSIALMTGDIGRINTVVVWVNSENTNMQMARYFEGSLSGTIRYLGAKRDAAGNVIDDVIAHELTGTVGSHASVQPGSVFVTGAGALERTNNVRKIFHVASVHGQLGRGYRQVDDVGRCVTLALDWLDSPELAGDELRSILFPLLGTGRGGGDLKQTAERLIRAAANYLKDTAHTRIESVCFLTWTDVELETCLAVLDAMPEVVAEARPRRRAASAA